MDHMLTHAKQTEGEAHRLSPLEAFVAWVANLIRTITGMKRRKVFPTNWRDHWEGLRQLEWCQAQIYAFCAAQVLAGKSLDDYLGFQLIMGVPADFGGRCPSTPQEMNRRFILQQRFRLDPKRYILRQIQRIAKRSGITLTTSASGCPLRLAALATSPALRAEEENHRACDQRRSLSSSNAKDWGRWHARACAHDGGGERRRRRRDLIQWIKSRSERPGRGPRCSVRAHARGPPPRLPNLHFQLPQRPSASENAPACAHSGTGLSTPPMTTRAATLRLMWQAIKRLAPARR